MGSYDGDRSNRSGSNLLPNSTKMGRGTSSSLWFVFFHGLLSIFARIWYFNVRKIFVFVNLFKEKRIVPPVKDEILLNSAVELARKIRAREITSEEIVLACIGRIKEINDQLNAVVETNFENALNEARRVDRAISDGSAPPVDQAPFLGVPFTAKDSLPISGMLTTCGIQARRDIRMFQDADCIATLRIAGAIPLAVTNISEMMMWWESFNTVYGRTNNPYDSRRTVGGSSGGEGALQASAGSVLSIGSDIGGSIRMPSHFNGIFGHKPTGDIVSIGGMIPPTKGFRTSMLVPGPMCRYAEDLAPILRVMAGPNANRLRLGEPVDFSQLRIFYMDGIQSVLTQPVEKDMLDAMHRAMKYFETRYNTLCYRLDLPLIHWIVQIWIDAMHEDGTPKFSQELCNRTGDLNPYLELLKCIVRQSNHTLPAISLAIVEDTLERFGSSKQRKQFDHSRVKLSRQIEELLGDNSVLFFPSHASVAPFHSQPMFMPMNFAFTGLFNALALPVTQCPMGLNDSGIPLGLQVAGASCRDHLTIAVAQELEKAFGGWVPPGSR